MKYKPLVAIIIVAALTVVLFTPWLIFHMQFLWEDRQWESETVTVVTLQVVGPGETPVPFEFDDVPDMSTPVIDYDKVDVCYRCWRLHCYDMHSGENYPVIPPWVPVWVMDYTLLYHVVPDYSERCPSH